MGWGVGRRGRPGERPGARPDRGGARAMWGGPGGRGVGGGANDPEGTAPSRRRSRRPSTEPGVQGSCGTRGECGEDQGGTERVDREGRGRDSVRTRKDVDGTVGEHGRTWAGQLMDPGGYRQSSMGNREDRAGQRGDPRATPRCDGRGSVPTVPVARRLRGRDNAGPGGRRRGR